MIDIIDRTSIARLPVGETLKLDFVHALREAVRRRMKLREVLDELRKEGCNVRCDGGLGYDVKRWRPGARSRELELLEAA